MSPLPRRGFLVKVRLNILVFAHDEEGAVKQALEEYERQMSFTGWSESELAGSAIYSTFRDEDGKDTFVDGVEELVVSTSAYSRFNGVWARRGE